MLLISLAYPLPYLVRQYTQCMLCKYSVAKPVFSYTTVFKIKIPQCWYTQYRPALSCGPQDYQALAKQRAIQLSLFKSFSLKAEILVPVSLWQQYVTRHMCHT